MTTEEATKVLWIMTGADGGCPNCVESLFKSFTRVFPDFKDLARAIYRKEFEGEVDL